MVNELPRACLFGCVFDWVVGQIIMFNESSVKVGRLADIYLPWQIPEYVYVESDFLGILQTPRVGFEPTT